MITLNDNQIAELLTVASGDVSYQSNYARTTAGVVNGRWTFKALARDVMDKMIEAERKAAYVAPVRPTVAPGPRSAPYNGPWPRGRHSHKCKGCEHKGQYNAVACYKSKCTKPQLSAVCEYCRASFEVAK